jgi:hypothetical protein
MVVLTRVPQTQQKNGEKAMIGQKFAGKKPDFYLK